MKKHEHLSTAKSLVGLLAFLIVVAIFYKFLVNQEFFFDDLEALRNYVMFAIGGGMLLIVLVYLASQTTHKAPVKSKSPKRKKN